jgi:hypothetical protein
VNVELPVFSEGKPDVTSKYSSAFLVERIFDKILTPLTTDKASRREALEKSVSSIL